MDEISLVNLFTRPWSSGTSTLRCTRHLDLMVLASGSPQRGHHLFCSIQLWKHTSHPSTFLQHVAKTMRTGSVPVYLTLQNSLSISIFACLLTFSQSNCKLLRSHFMSVLPLQLIVTQYHLNFSMSLNQKKEQQSKQACAVWLVQPWPYH